jgi:hypothetical protein
MKRLATAKVQIFSSVTPPHSVTIVLNRRIEMIHISGKYYGRNTIENIKLKIENPPLPPPHICPTFDTFLSKIRLWRTALLTLFCCVFCLFLLPIGYRYIFTILTYSFASLRLCVRSNWKSKIENLQYRSSQNSHIGPDDVSQDCQ